MSPRAGTPRPVAVAFATVASALGALGALGVLGACSEQREDSGSRALYELERLAFVPRRAASIDGFTRLEDVTIEEPLLVDAFELTRRDLLHYGLELADSGFRADVVGLEERKLDWPAFLDWYQAAEIARLRGMRLPTVKEWMHVAVGARSQAYPWGNRFQVSIANTLELGLRRPTPVGTFENGRSPRFGCYDLLGNVWEWAADRAPGYDEAGDKGGTGPASYAIAGDELASVLGGGYDANARRLFGTAEQSCYFARTLDRRTLSPAVGARMVADAGPYLLRHAPLWGEDAEARRRVARVARTWAESAGRREALVSLLADLRSRPDAPPQLAWLAQGLEATP